jgi:mono/diheme cytochrome c family protein
MTTRWLAPLVFVAACSAPPAESPPPTASTPVAKTDPRVEADVIFGQRCTPCHGATGAGDGAASASLNPRPRNFRDPEWQKSVPDEYIEKIVAYGGQAVGKSAAMPPNPDLAEKQAVIAALRDKVRGFRRD